MNCDKVTYQHEMDLPKEVVISMSFTRRTRTMVPLLATMRCSKFLLSSYCVIHEVCKKDQEGGKRRNSSCKDGISYVEDHHVA